MADADVGAFFQNVRNLIRRSGDDSQIDGSGQLFERSPTRRMSENVVIGIDRIGLDQRSAVHDAVPNGRAASVGFYVGTDNGYGVRNERVVQMVRKRHEQLSVKKEENGVYRIVACRRMARKQFFVYVSRIAEVNDR